MKHLAVFSFLLLQIVLQWSYLYRCLCTLVGIISRIQAIGNFDTYYYIALFFHYNPV